VTRSLRRTFALITRELGNTKNLKAVSKSSTLSAPTGITAIWQRVVFQQMFEGKGRFAQNGFALVVDGFEDRKPAGTYCHGDLIAVSHGQTDPVRRKRC